MGCIHLYIHISILLSSFAPITQWLLSKWPWFREREKKNIFVILCKNCSWMLFLDFSPVFLWTVQADKKIKPPAVLFIVFRCLKPLDYSLEGFLIWQLTLLHRSAGCLQRSHKSLCLFLVTVQRVPLNLDMHAPVKPHVSISIEVSLSSDLLFVIKQRESRNSKWRNLFSPDITSWHRLTNVQMWIIESNSETKRYYCIDVHEVLAHYSFTVL